MRAVSRIAGGSRSCTCGLSPALPIVSLLTLLLLLSPPSARATPLPTLLTIRQAHTLPAAEAQRGYPVHLAHAQVIFYDPSIFCLFVMDSSDAIFVDFRKQPPPKLETGDIVAVDAVTGPGKVNPVLLHASFRVLRHAPLPDAPRVSFDRILSGAFDSRWIAMEGVVRSVRRPTELTAYAGEPGFGSTNLILTLSSGPELIDVITREPGSADYRSLVDARVRVRAAVGCRFNQRQQLIGVHVYMPDLSFVKVLEPQPAHPFSLPLSATSGVTRRFLLAPGHRVHVRGVVTSTFGNRQFSLSDPEHGIFVTSQDPTPVAPGDLVDVAGFPSSGDYTTYLDAALVRRIGSAPPPPPFHLTATEAFAGDHDAEPIELDGLLLDRSRAESGVTSLLFTDAGISWLAVLAPGANGAFLNTIPLGSRVRIRGICVIHADADKTPQTLDLLFRSPADLTVLQSPSWWTSRNTLILAIALLATITAVVFWNVILRRRVRAQTRVIQIQLDQAQNLRLQAEAAHKEKSDSLASVLSLQRDLLEAQEKLRYQATHDALTGLWNRRALLELLEKEIERCCRTQSSMGILMLDVDHFKPVNDTFGHLVGDQVLKEIALRIAHATRGYDLAGRYGGEEFLILLPGCNPEQTEAGAERIRFAISSLPIQVAGSSISLTASIGATVAPDSAATETEILSLADLALYEAKTSGRNQTVLRLSSEEIPVALK